MSGVVVVVVVGGVVVVVVVAWSWSSWSSVAWRRRCGRRRGGRRDSLGDRLRRRRRRVRRRSRRRRRGRRLRRGRGRRAEVSSLGVAAARPAPRWWWPPARSSRSVSWSGELLAEVSEYATPPAAISAMSAAAPIANCGIRRAGRAGVLIGPVGGMYSTRGRGAGPLDGVRVGLGVGHRLRCAVVVLRPRQRRTDVPALRRTRWSRRRQPPCRYPVGASASERAASSAAPMAVSSPGPGRRDHTGPTSLRKTLCDKRNTGATADSGHCRHVGPRSAVALQQILDGSDHTVQRRVGQALEFGSGETDLGRGNGQIDSEAGYRLRRNRSLACRHSSRSWPVIRLRQWPRIGVAGFGDLATTAESSA